MIFDLEIYEIITALLLLGSLFFFLASAIGMIRLPDFYSRLHASGNSETMGLMLASLGLVIYELCTGTLLTAIKLIIIFLLVFLANPIGTHILGKAALKSGHPVWTVEDKEDK
jgi:multicomponent Na+:H+ antiporter subunit G